MFVGESGVARVIERTCQLMKQSPSEDVTKLGGVPLDMIQRALNLWCTLSYDLFGGEISSNAATYFASGIKGRAYEMKKYEDHRALEGDLAISVPKDGRLIEERIALRNAMNEILRGDYKEDNERVVERWNRVLEENEISGFRFKIPSTRFNRAVGIYAGHTFSPTGELVTQEEWDRRRSEWLLSDQDIAYLKSIQVPVVETGKFANWIAPPRVGIKGRPVEFEYVRL